MNVLDPAHALDLWEKRHSKVVVKQLLSHETTTIKPRWFNYKLTYPANANQLVRRLFGALRSFHIPSAVAGELAPLSFPKASSGYVARLREEYERNLLWLHSIDPSLALPCEIGQVIDVPSHIHHIYLPWQMEVVRQLEKKHHAKHEDNADSDEKSQQTRETEKQAKRQQMKKEFWSLMDDDAKFAYVAAAQAQKQLLHAYPFLDVHLSDLGNGQKPHSPSLSETKQAGSPQSHKNQASTTEDIGAQRGRRLSQPLVGRVRSHSAPAAMVSDHRFRAPPADAVAAASLLPITTSFIVSSIRSLLTQQPQQQQSQPALNLTRDKSAPASERAPTQAIVSPTA